MGKYRTFPKKVAHFHSEVDGVHDPKRVVNNGNGLSCNVFIKSGLLPVRSEVEWQEWKQGRFKRGLPRLPLLILALSGSILCLPLTTFAQPTTTTITTSKVSPVEASGSPVSDLINHYSPEGEGVADKNPFFGEGHNLQSLRNCTPPSSDEFPQDLFTKEQRQNGGIAVHFFVAFYMLYALLLVCENYFVPAIECICEELHIPHNIAGATLMAISTSAPELFTNVIGTFVTKGDLGVGTIVGSAVFNVLAVGGAIGIGTNFAVSRSQISPYSKRSKRKGVPLDWWSLSRDSFYYVLSVLILIGVLADGRVYWQEALIMLCVYGFYIAGMCYDAQCKGIAKTLVEKVRKAFNCDAEFTRKLSVVVGRKLIETDGERAPLLRQGSKGSVYGTREAGWEDVEKNVISNTTDDLYPPMKIERSPSKEVLLGRKVSLVEVLTAPTDADFDSTSISSLDSGSSEDSVSSTVMMMGGVKDVIAFPLNLTLSWTIPDCRKEHNRKWCVLSLLGCVGWIAGLSYVISWMVCIIGGTFGIPDSVSGLTFLAAGTSLPEVISSVIVARQGLGSMGLSNSVGSNTFDVLVCLGLPWLIQSAILTAQDTNYIEIQSGGLAYSAIALIATFAILYLVIAINGYTLDTKVGVTCVILYVIFIVFACMLEMNMFFHVNLPPC